MSAAAPLPRSRAVALVALLAAPYLLNDLGNIHVHAPGPWLACDYGSRVISLATIVWLLRRGIIAREDLLLRLGGLWRAAACTLAAAVGGVLLSTSTARDAFSLIKPGAVGYIPEISPGWLREFDYLAGIALTAVSEELAFRAVLPRLVVRAGGSAGLALVVSSVLFGLAHWSLGAGAVVQTALIGALLAAAVRQGRSLWPAIVAHDAIDLYMFG